MGDAFDRIVEVRKSSWKNQILRERKGYVPDYMFSLKHFMIYTEDFGSIQVLADSFEIMAEESGDWQSLIAGLREEMSSAD